MKKVIGFLLVVGFISFIFLSIDVSKQLQSAFPEPCSEAITYKIGTVSSVYNISEEELKKILQQVDTVWSGAVNKNLFKYSETGSIAVNLVFGEQQRFINKERAASVKINAQKTSYRHKERALERIKEDHQELKNEYEALVSDFRDLPSNGRSRSKAKRLINQIRQKEAALNSKTEMINRHIQELNNISTRISEMVDAYNEEYGSLRKFNQGDYQETAEGKNINIYGYEDHAELQLVLAHEMGHALGLEHVQNSESVMYYLMQDQPTERLALTAQDIAALEARCEN